MAEDIKPKNSDGWNEWSRFVLKELERSNENDEGVKKEIQSLRDEIAVLRGEIAILRTDLAMLNVKSGLWGFAAGAVPVAIALAIRALG